MIDLTTTVTGVAIGGLVTPTYVLTADTPPAPNSKQSLVTSGGGTQTGVRFHAPSDPFSITQTKPLVTVGYPRANAQGQIPARVGRNKYDTLFRKGTVCLVGQAPQVSDVRLTANIASGAEVNDTANLAALWSLVAAFAHREAANYLVMSKTSSI